MTKINSKTKKIVIIAILWFFTVFFTGLCVHTRQRIIITNFYIDFNNMTQIHKALSKYYDLNNTFPEKLDQLHEIYPQYDHPLTNPYGYNYIYHKVDNSYFLKSLGMDNEKGGMYLDIDIIFTPTGVELDNGLELFKNE